MRGVRWQSLQYWSETFPRPRARFWCATPTKRRSPYSRVLGRRIRRAARSPLCLLLARKSASRPLPDPSTPLVLVDAAGAPRAADKAGATHTSAASDYPPITSDSTISSLLTLFSKFFSPFLRSTCSLSVSHKYLALEEVYLPFRAAVPNNPTLGGLSLRPATAADGAFTLCGVLFQGTHAVLCIHAFASTL